METGTVRILIVEDEKIVAADIRRMLIHSGYHVVNAVPSGKEAIETAAQKKPDLVLMDISLKGKMDGIETAQIIRATQDIPIIYLTAHTGDKILEKAKATGPYGYIVKPFEETDLKTTIEVAMFKHQMGQKVKESEQRFREIFEQNFSAIVLFKRPGFQVIEVNPMAETVFQYSKKELIDNFSVVFDSEEIYRLLKNELCGFHHKNSEVFLDRCRLKKKDGSGIICSIESNVIKIGEDDVLYCSFRDITDKIKAENEAMFLQSQLIRAHKMTSIGTLAAGIAHEVNNPNNFIMSNTQIIAQVWDDAVKILREYGQGNNDFVLGGLSFEEVENVVPRLIMDVIEGSRRIKAITGNLGDYARPVDARSFVKVSINDVLNFAGVMLKNEIKKYTDSFAFEPGDNIPLIHAHPRQLEQVFINLIQNALHALPERTRGVCVSSVYDKKNRDIVVTVTDEGTGMADDILERITDPFFSTKHNNGGTGLGLYISYSIVKQHNGTLDFNSIPGKGTAAVVRIPETKNDLATDGRG
jgi:PAS domain S-box-containing protein